MKIYLNKYNTNNKEYINNNSNGTYDDENSFGPFNEVNLFVGANNAGKSRFLRNIYKTYNLLVIPFEQIGPKIIDVEEIITHLQEILRSQEIIIQSSGQGITEFPEENILYKKYLDNHIRSIKINRGFLSTYFETITSSFAKIHIKELRESLLEEIICLKVIINTIKSKLIKNERGDILLAVSGKLEYQIEIQVVNKYFEWVSILNNIIEYLEGLVERKNNNIYLPPLRYSSYFHYDYNEHKHEEDLIEITYQNKYFIDKISSNNIIPLSDAKIYSGQTLHNDIISLRTGNKDKRDSFSNFERFIGQNFFAGKEVDIVAKIDKLNTAEENILIRIGSEEKDIFNLGDGIQALIILLFPIFTAKDETWFFIEEPELNLHPNLQRLFLETILYNSTITNKKHKFFITTHSNHFTDSKFIKSELITTFLFKKDQNEQDIFQLKVIDNESDYEILEELGVHNTSVLIGNCSIWVEGITDRLYLKKLLQLYYESDTFKSNRKKVYNEDIHFAFFEYAGSNISHYIFNKSSKGDTEKKILANKLSNRILLLADYDLKCIDDLNSTNYKKKRHELLNSIADNNKSQFRYLTTSPRKEIENTISTDILRIILPKLLNDPIGSVQLEYSKYKSIGLGKYIINETNTPLKMCKNGADTLATFYKNKLANLFFEESSLTWEMLSDEMKDITVSVYEFIDSANK